MLRVDRKVAIEFLNDVTSSWKTTSCSPKTRRHPLRQLYFIAQMILIIRKAGPVDRDVPQVDRHAAYCFKHDEVLAELKRIDGLVTQGRAFEALKAIRGFIDRGPDPHAQELTPATVEQYARRSRHGG